VNLRHQAGGSGPPPLAVAGRKTGALVCPLIRPTIRPIIRPLLYEVYRLCNFKDLGQKVDVSREGSDGKVGARHRSRGQGGAVPGPHAVGGHADRALVHSEVPVSHRETTDFVDGEETSETKLVPDAAFIMENIETGKRARFFVEMDMGSERIISHHRRDHQITLHYKLAQYDRYLESLRYCETYKEYGEFRSFTLMPPSQSPPPLPTQDAARALNKEKIIDKSGFGMLLFNRKLD
jgi:hypothetical protein